ncbi:hypothetical protein [Streptomyces sp. NPDC057740]|uniref:hypothetical protein n=1 Tax=Streptomyces sp. NPDC057740 TaxID=3346234 RepID=UPI0036C7DC35
MRRPTSGRFAEETGRPRRVAGKVEDPLAALDAFRGYGAEVPLATPLPEGVG